MIAGIIVTGLVVLVGSVMMMGFRPKMIDLKNQKVTKTPPNLTLSFTVLHKGKPLKDVNIWLNRYEDDPNPIDDYTYKAGEGMTDINGKLKFNLHYNQPAKTNKYGSQFFNYFMHNKVKLWNAGDFPLENLIYIDDQHVFSSSHTEYSYLIECDGNKWPKVKQVSGPPMKMAKPNIGSAFDKNRLSGELAKAKTLTQKKPTMSLPKSNYVIKVLTDTKYGNSSIKWTPYPSLQDLLTATQNDPVGLQGLSNGCGIVNYAIVGHKDFDWSNKAGYTGYYYLGVTASPDMFNSVVDNKGRHLIPVEQPYSQIRLLVQKQGYNSFSENIAPKVKPNGALFGVVTLRQSAKANIPKGSKLVNEIPKGILDKLEITPTTVKKEQAPAEPKAKRRNRRRRKRIELE